MASTSQISSYMHHARTMPRINDHALTSNVDIDCNNAKRYVDTNKTNTDCATIINEGYHSSQNTNIWSIYSQHSSSIYIRSKQDEFMNQFNQLTLNESDEISIDLFHLLKASNKSLILFNSFMSWVKRHQDNLATNGNKQRKNYQQYE